MSLYLGLMSGTSMDGVDAALASFDAQTTTVVGSITAAYPGRLRDALRTAIAPDARLTLHEYATLNIEVGIEFARAATRLITQTKTSAQDIVAIGSHGQTLRHSPNSDLPYSIQIGDPATIAERCGITTVADFRTLDLAAGGQGAPLAPAFHSAVFRDKTKNTVVVNIGGIANITVLPAAPSDILKGFDTGPGNCLMDEWIHLHKQQGYDEGGRWAATGHLREDLLTGLMADEYIERAAPKSTGREYFNLAFLIAILDKLKLSNLAAEDVQSTLAEYTVLSIARGISQTESAPARVIVCGGGAHNDWLMQRLAASFPRAEVHSADKLNIAADAIEAVAFAWFAKQRIALEPIRLTTGSAKPRLLGAVYEPSP